MPRKPDPIPLNAAQMKLFEFGWKSSRVKRATLAAEFSVSRYKISAWAHRLGWGPKVPVRPNVKNVNVRKAERWGKGSHFEDHPNADIDRRRTPVGWRA